MENRYFPQKTKGNRHFLCFYHIAFSEDCQEEISFPGRFIPSAIKKGAGNGKDRRPVCSGLAVLVSL